MFVNLYILFGVALWMQPKYAADEKRKEFVQYPDHPSVYPISIIQYAEDDIEITYDLHS